MKSAFCNWCQVLWILAAIVLASCSVFTPSPTPTPTATPVPPSATPTPTVPAPTATLTDTPSPTPEPSATTPLDVPTATTIPESVTFTVDTNCRAGPGLVYSVVVIVRAGQVIKAEGRNADSSWWLLSPSNSPSPCWVSNAVVAFSGSPGVIPVVAAPPTPTSTITLTPTAESTATVTATIVVPPTVPPPGPPLNTNCETLSHEEIRVTWIDNSGSETEYRVERSLDGQSWNEVAVIPADPAGQGGLLEHVDSGLDADTAYFYRVRAFRQDDGAFSEYGGIVTCTTGSAP